jgi:hypothetical protein|tara:strand:- start:666 stop:848 length:183 start_codon:yes stop_codon:yes gene_type:complete
MLTKIREILNYLNGAADRTYQSIIDLAESLARTGIRLMYFVLLYKLAVGDLITQLLSVMK